MSAAQLEQVDAALGAFSSITRLYEITLEGDGAQDAGPLLVEAFAGDEQLQTPGARDVIVLSTTAQLALAPMLGKLATLQVSLFDGSRASFSGHVSEAAMLGSFGGLARYRLRLTPWLWRLGQVRNSRVWQDKSVIEIVESVFQSYVPAARWRWSDDTRPFMDGAAVRSYCCQYRESDLDFVGRLLTEEGLAWRFEEQEGGHCLVLFADSSADSAVPEDASSAAGGGIRFHGARAGEQGDTLQAFSTARSLNTALASVLSYDYKAKRAVAAGVPTRTAMGGQHAPLLESYDTPGQYYYADAAQASRYALLRMQALEARSERCVARSTVRTLRAGTRFRLTQGPLQGAGGDAPAPAYTVLRVCSVGVNNLPAPARQGLAELFGPIPELLQESLGTLNLGPRHIEHFEQVIAQAVASGYANHLEAIPAATPWRPVLGENGLRQHPKPTACGSQSAIVVGADGQDAASGADEIYCDRLGRVRIRFHWQQETGATCWVRVAQRAAGGGMGSQFLPRIGQEVLVQFLENDIDRPVIVGALYNGQGEGGTKPTPGDVGGESGDAGVFQPAHDHAVAGQGNVAGGNSPLWHGAAGASAAHRNASAQWGIRSKEFGKAGGLAGYNQLLFDDTDSQGRVQLKSSHAASELTLGHLIHGADNYRGSLRGAGAELRTDAYGAVRAGAGLLISSYLVNHVARARDPAGDNAPGMALLKQAAKLGETFSEAAVTHQGVAYAAHLGATAPGSSTLDAKAAPLPAFLTSASGMLSRDSVDAARSDAAGKPVAPAEDKLPHSSDAIIAVAAKAGLGVVAGQDMQLSNGETATLMSGLDTQFASGGQWRLHTGQAIGMLGGVVKPGEGELGVQLVAASQPIEVQAQSDEIKVQAREEVNVISANAHIDWAAAKSIRLSTAGGANITIEGGNITIQCPGKITVFAGKKSFLGPAGLGYPLPRLPRSELALRPLKFLLRLADTPGLKGHALAHTPWKIAHGAQPDGMDFIDDDKLVAQGKTDASGNIKLSDAEEEKLAAVYASNPDHTWIVYPGHSVRLNVETESPDWSDKEKLFHAMQAADFSAGRYGTIFEAAAAPQARYAKEALASLTLKNILPKVKV
ncbi:type VI secretion system Vgr family protein [Janthinobacterium lividum]|uniref:type VI secretion system Vgr family protein n=2 Tax=Janthinobacterium TaxID=29580 RepID=UPI00044D0D8A|nr:type VI secretion system Vgr family protein [Janthinobacterium lividum]EZP37314.1 Rhs element Vgr protein [Janthinobacterium lividum]